MRKGWLIFFWLLTIVVVLILLIFVGAKGKTSNIIQAIAIITLIFVTWFYTKQTQGLVEQQRAFLEQQKLSLDEEKKKRNADFEEKKLKEFYNPFKYLLFELRSIVENEASPSIPTLELQAKIAKLGSGYGHMITGELEDKAVDLLNHLFEVTNINEEDEEQLETWRKKALEKIRDVMKQKQKEIDIIRSIINETYELFSERLDNISTREEKGVNHENP